MMDDMKIFREFQKLNKEMQDMKEVVSSTLDLQNRMMSCESSINSPHLNVDFVTGNVDRAELFELKNDLEIGRECMAMGAFEAGMSYFHDANELVVTSRSKFGTLIKLMRSQLTKTETSISEDSSGGGWFGRNRKRGEV